jgi:mono/diheme cytochrome c family protein
MIIAPSTRTASRGARHIGRALLLFVSLLAAAPDAFGQAGDATRGLYLSKASGCQACHTEAREGATPYAGGRALKTPFGTFFGPNITPHRERGIGKWSEADFVRAMREGLRPDGAHYFPSFPYTSFTRINDADLRDLWAFLRALPANDTPSKPHDLGFPFNLRFLLWGWKWLNFSPGVYAPAPGRPPEVSRGGYLVEALGHCGECHTPRDALGGLRRELALSGNPDAPGGGKVPNITPRGIGKWSDGDLKEFLTSGMTPDGDFAGGEMGEVIRHGTSQLTPDDLAAMIAYLRSLPPRPAP